MDPLPGLLLVCGAEPLLVDRDVARWRAMVTRAGGEVEVLPNSTRLDALTASLTEIPLFGDQRHLLLRDPPQLAGVRRSGAADELAAALARRAATTLMCIAVRAPLTAPHPVLDEVARQGGRVIQHAPLRPAEKRSWLEGECRRRSLRLPPGGTELLLRATGGDLGALSGELDKLLAHGPPIDRPTMERLVAGGEQLELYRVLDLLAGPRPAEGAALLIGLVAEGHSTQYLISILAGQLRDLLLVHALLLRGISGGPALATAMGLPAWRVDRLLRQAHSVPAPLAAGWLSRLQRIDAGVKTGEVDDSAALRLLGLSAAHALAGPSRSNPRRGAG